MKRPRAFENAVFLRRSNLALPLGGGDGRDSKAEPVLALDPAVTHWEVGAHELAREVLHRENAVGPQRVVRAEAIEVEREVRSQDLLAQGKVPVNRLVIHRKLLRKQVRKHRHRLRRRSRVAEGEDEAEEAIVIEPLHPGARGCDGLLEALRRCLESRAWPSHAARA